MTPKNYQKIIESLNIDFVQARTLEVVRPITIRNAKHMTNKLVVLHQGFLSIETSEHAHIMRPGDIYFFPAGSKATVHYGSNEGVIMEKGKVEDYPIEYITPVEVPEKAKSNHVLSVIEFSVRAYNAIDFFKFIELPSFLVEKSELVSDRVNHILLENKASRIGFNQLIRSNIIACAVVLIRHIIESNLFLDKIGIKIDALMDRRLVNIFCYISSNLTGDLSNHAIAEKVGLSKDYVGQFFKKITDMNLQEYIQYVRIDRAVDLITNTNNKIGDISKMVGVNDFAYFCRMFKRTVGISAKQMQKRSIGKTQIAINI